jgi:two-component system CheB/CheR fusion protein
VVLRNPLPLLGGKARTGVGTDHAPGISMTKSPDALPGAPLPPDGGAAPLTQGAPPAPDFPIVGIGASAGGLEAFSQLLGALPGDTGMAFVLIQHLDPAHESTLPEALAETTQMPVSHVVADERPQPNHVYVIPPNTNLELRAGTFRLSPRLAGEPHLPVDAFFRSLAEERGHHAIGVILSGTASDGTEGLRAIKAKAGVSFAQDPNSAKFGGMPSSAVAARVVDHCLALPELASELVNLSRHPYFATSAEPGDGGDTAAEQALSSLVRSATGVDFSEYKSPTVRRRTARRMALRNVAALPAYVALLQREPDEVRALCEEILIHVTSFFRDAEAFAFLKAEVLPAIVKGKADAAPIRVWVAGCASGEEVYSVAIALLEVLGENLSAHPVQIFGTDVSEATIQRARHGVFTENATKDLSEERKRNFFVKDDAGYRIAKSVRDLCVFVRHDLSRDPPFSRLDLVCCRNVLIYFGAALQKRVIPTFHYALQPGGFLLLGRTENVQGFSHLFAPLDKQHNVFVRSNEKSALRFAPRSDAALPSFPVAARAPVPSARRATDLTKHLDSLLLSRYAPPGVLVDEELEVLQFRGETGNFLQAAQGEPQTNLLRMVRPNVVPALRATMAQARRDMLPVRSEGLQVERAESASLCNLLIIPVGGVPKPDSRLFLVLFETGPRTSDAVQVPLPKAEPAPKDAAAVARLTQDLEATKAYLQSLVDDQDHANDELNAANEELVSGNEELQSMNEELETAKEELQSTNEELLTVNDELQHRNQELGVVNADLGHLLSTVDIPVIILDPALRIRRITPRARNIFNLQTSDVGRPIADFRSNLRDVPLAAHIADAVARNVVHESEVQDLRGVWYRLQIRPYAFTDGSPAGSILSLVDIDTLKRNVHSAEVAKAESDRANRAKDEFLATLSHEIRTPLSSMLMQAQLLRFGPTDAAQTARAANIIERGVRAQVKLIDDMLDVSRIVTGKLKMEMKPLELGNVIRAALDDVSANAEKKAISMTVSLDEGCGRVLGDASRLRQVLVNLLGNAIKSSTEGSEVHTTLERTGDAARISVSDTGSGIDPAFLPKIFNRFAQADETTTRRHGGLGLGLAIAHHIVEAHGGSIEASSAGQGKGALFRVTLPLAMPRAVAEVPLRLTADSESGAALATSPFSTLLLGQRVLVVDDDAETRDTVAEVLRNHGAAVWVAGSASEALERIERDTFDLLVCDIAMPGEDGYSLIRRIRARAPEHGGATPALALTAFAGAENRARALAAGFQQYLAKPVDMDQLTQTLVTLAKRRASAPCEA